MYSKAAIVRVLCTSMALTIALSGCVKQRDEMVLQSDLNLRSIQQEAPLTNKAWSASTNFDSFLRKTPHVIKTANILFKSQNSIAEQLIAEEESQIRFLDVVNFTSTHPLLDGKAEIAYMLGQPFKQYEVVEELTPTHLILYKVVSDEELSFNEQTIALRYEGKWRVPVGGYRVNYFKRARVKNEDNRDTNIASYFAVPAQDYKTATDFRVDSNDFIPFTRFVKSDVLPKTFFEGEWYFTETTVETRYDNSNAVGDLGGSDSNFSSATRIKFRIFDDQIVGLNTNVDEDFKDDPNSLNYNTVIKIQVDHRDFNWIRKGEDSLKEIEEEVKDKEEKRFVRLHYLNSETPQSTLEGIFASIFGRINNFRNVLDVTYGKNYFSYSIRDAQSGTIKRYSMRKIDTKEQMAPRQAFKDDNRIYGTFVTQRYKKFDYKIARQSDIEDLLIMARHNPKKDIVYHFTTNTPKEKWFRDIGRASIDLWNQAFKKAGLKINIRLDESKDVALGDIRYNVLNIVNRAGEGLLGFGPSLIDSESGEIVSASMNTGVDNIIRQMYSVVRDYLGRKSGVFYNFRKDDQPNDMPSVLKIIAQINSGLYTVDAESGKLVLDGKNALNPAVFTDKEKEFLRYFDLSPDMSISELVEKVSELKVHSYKYANLGGPFNVALFSDASSLSSSTEVLDETIERNCKEVVNLAEALKKNPLITTPEEMKIIEPCVRLLAHGEAVLTTVHELGHNLSLRHNFRGSVDKDNYPKISDYELRHVKLAEGVARPMSSSIMEYVTNEGQQVMPGKYDLAAIRWIYNEEVETSDGKIVKIDTKKRIEDNVGSVENLKRYQFCTDEHRILVTDAMCTAFDKGTSVKESVRFQIEQLYNVMSSTYRYDKVGPGNPFISLWLGQGRSMKAKYDEWRGFLRKYTGTNKSYLQGYDLKSYNALIAGIKARGGKEAAELNEHLEVRNMIVRFLVDIAFISNKYCVVINGDNEEKLLELEKIRKELFGIRDFSEIKTCKSPSAAKYIQERGYKLVKEFGHFLDPGQFNQDPSRRLEPLDFVGTGALRGFAMYYLTVRDAPSINNQIEGFFPSMLDEPDIRNYVQFLILDRIISGVRLTHDNSKSEYAIPKSDLFGANDVEKIQKLKAYINFNNEAPLIQGFTEIMSMNLWMPGAQDDGRRGYVNVSVGDPSQIENIKSIADDYFEYLDRVLYVRDRNSFAGQVMGRFKQLNQQKELMAVQPKVIADFKGQILKGLNDSGLLFVPPKKHTTKDFINLVIGLDNLMQQLSQSPEGRPVLFILSKIFTPEISLFNGLMQYLQSQGLTLEQLMKNAESTNAEEKAVADQILALPIEPNYVDLNKQDPSIFMPSSGEMEKRYNKLLADHTASFNNYTSNLEELDSQIDLLQRVVQILSQ